MAAHDAPSPHQRAPAPIRAPSREGAPTYPGVRDGSPEPVRRCLGASRGFRRSRIRRRTEQVEAHMERGESCRRILSRGRLFQLGRSSHADPRPCAYHAIRAGLCRVDQHDSIRAGPGAGRARRGGFRRSGFGMVAGALAPVLRPQSEESTRPRRSGSVPSRSWPRARRPTVSCPPRRRPS